MADLRQVFNQAIAALQSKQAGVAIELCDVILSELGSHPDAFHIKALAEKQQGNMGAAKQNFQHSLSCQPKQAAVLSNYANLLMSLGEFNDASEQFAKSVQIDNSNADAWLNWSLLLCKVGNNKGAEDKLQEALAIHPQDPRLFNLLGNVQQQLGKLDDAVEAYKQVLAKTPTDVPTLHNLGITYRLKLMPEQSLKYYQQIQNLAQVYPELLFNMGCAYYDLNDKEQAVRCLQHALELKPDYVDAHEALNKLYWEDGDKDRFLQSYRQSLKQAPNSVALQYSHVAMLMMAKQYEDAQQALEDAIVKIGKEHVFLHALAVLKSKKHRNEEVLTLLKECVAQQENNTRYQIDIANYYIQHFDYQLALQHLEKAALIAPLNQEVWAYKGICWRLMGDARASWLNNYHNFIQAELLDVPAGYDDLPQFLQVLRQELTKMHRTKHQPLDQSVMGGTQTVGRLLSEPAQVIKDFKTVLEKRINNYLDNLPKDANHPFLNRITGQFEFSGSWSVSLNSGGFHINHMHPEGWLSCCTYIDVPQELSPDDVQKSGWIKFGETSLELDDRETVGKEVCPQQGLCVLFPSYFWHGTNPFKAESQRMTIPCDIMPVN
jgi:tetratricopeptide (TPR) repeat protein